MKLNIGMIGFGKFGQFFSHHLARMFDVTVYDVRNHSRIARAAGIAWGTFEEVASKDIVIVAVPLRAMERVLKQLAQCVQAGTLVIDVCSVKTEPVRLMREILSGTKAELIGTHPVFGPESAKDGLKDHKIAICPITEKRSRKTRALFRFFRGQGLQIMEMKPDAHDRDMANVQAVTHLITRTLRLMRLPMSDFATVAYKHLMKAVELHSGDSWPLFFTIQDNPYAAPARRRFRSTFEYVERRIQENDLRTAA